MNVLDYYFLRKVYGSKVLEIERYAQQMAVVQLGINGGNPQDLLQLERATSIISVIFYSAMLEQTEDIRKEKRCTREDLVKMVEEGELKIDLELVDYEEFSRRMANIAFYATNRQN